MMAITVAHTRRLTYREQFVLEALSQCAAPIEITALAEELRKTFGAPFAKLAETLLSLMDEKCVERIEGADSSVPRYARTSHGLARLIAAEANAILDEPINPRAQKMRVRAKLTDSWKCWQESRRALENLCVTMQQIATIVSADELITLPPAMVHEIKRNVSRFQEQFALLVREQKRKAVR
jgi:Fe2+ or Zn2+ uptake regulation protein